MNKFRLACAILLAIPLIVFGGNYFVDLFTLPKDTSPGGQLLQSMRDGGLMAAVAFSHVVVGVLLLLPRTRFLGGMLQLPMSIGILAFHATMLPKGVGMALGMLALNLGAMFELHKIRALLTKPPTA